MIEVLVIGFNVKGGVSMAQTRLRGALIEKLTELDTLNDEAEVERRLQYLNKISDSIVEYENYLSQNHFNNEIRMLCERGLQFIAVENTSLIKQKWDELFTSGISNSVKKKVCYHQFRWHIFSYKKLEAEEKQVATNSFLNSSKSDVYIFFQHSDECYKIENSHLLEFRDIKNPKILDVISDFYIFDMAEKWSYICTHEENCGPYFYQVK